MTSKEPPKAFEFSRSVIRGREEQHVVIVHGRAVLAENYNVEDVVIVDVPYDGGGWDKFMTRACDALRLGRRSMQIFTEACCDRSRERPIVIYVGNARALARDCSEDLLRYVLFWEGFALGNPREPAYPMFLVLQMPDER